ncbi:MAG: S1 family peptidase [Actinomycetota bacterium]|nr:S1 family peptidase [Actinomycetota bacterium]
MSQREAEGAALARVREAKAVHARRLLAHPDVHGIGVGFKEVGGKKTRELAVVVHVHRKRPKEQIARTQLLPRTLTIFSKDEGGEVEVPVDVREKPVPVPEVDCGTCDEDLGGRFRPVGGGCSGGLTDVAGGTLGGWVWDNEGEQLVLISNEHVLGSTAGATVIQPSIGDGGTSPDDDIGSVVRAGTLDVAIAAPSNGDLIDANIICSGPAVFETVAATLEMEVEKVGQTTGLTCGFVELIDYDSGHHGSSNDLWINGDGSDFSQGGDSGSLYVERVNPNGDSWKRIVGIHWGGSGDDGIGHPIGPVMTDLNVTTVCSGLVQAFIEALFGEEEAEEAEPARVPALAGFRLPKLKHLPLKRPIGRSVEASVVSTELGARLNEMLHQHRVEAVELLLDAEGRRAAISLLAPLARESATVDELLEHVVDARDRKNAARFLSVARKLSPKLAESLSFGEDILGSAEGRKVADVLGAAKK